MAPFPLAQLPDELLLMIMQELPAVAIMVASSVSAVGPSPRLGKVYSGCLP